MGGYRASIEWSRDHANFSDNRYSRGHRWRFDGVVDVAASSSPRVVPPPMSIEAAVGPDEAFVASLANCYMLWFLALAQKRDLVVDRYSDDAIGTLALNADRKMTMTDVLLRVRVIFADSPQPDNAAIVALHHATHEQCYIANSVTTQIRCESLRADGEPLTLSTGTTK